MNLQKWSQEFTSISTNLQKRTELISSFLLYTNSFLQQLQHQHIQSITNTLYQRNQVAHLPIQTLPHGAGEVSIFALGPYTTLPYHDHPGMTVITVPLPTISHDVHVQSISIQDLPSTPLYPSQTLRGIAMPAPIPIPQSRAWITWPDAGNIHAFSAQGDQPVAFADFIFPGYAPPQRPCTYFSAAPQPDAEVALPASFEQVAEVSLPGCGDPPVTYSGLDWVSCDVLVEPEPRHLQWSLYQMQAERA